MIVFGKGSATATLATFAAFASATSLIGSGSYSPSMTAVDSVRSGNHVYTVGNNGGLVSVRKIGPVSASIDYDSGSAVQNVAITSDAQGNVYTLGSRGDSFSVSKFDANLNRLWTQNHGTGGTTAARDLIVGSDGGTVITLADASVDGVAQTQLGTLDGATGDYWSTRTYTDPGTQGADLTFFNNTGGYLITTSFASGADRYLRFREVGGSGEVVRTYDYMPKTGPGPEKRGGSWSLQSLIVSPDDQINFTATNATSTLGSNVYLVRLARSGANWAPKWYHRDGILFRGAKARIAFAVDEANNVYATSWFQKLNYPANDTEIGRAYMVYRLRAEDGRKDWFRFVYDGHNAFGASDANLGDITVENNGVRVWWRETNGGGGEFMSLAEIDAATGQAATTTGPLAYTATATPGPSGPFRIGENTYVAAADGWATWNESL